MLTHCSSARSFHLFQRLCLLSALFVALCGGVVAWNLVHPRIVHADSTNLVQNPGFESGKANWYDFAGTASITTSVVHGGSSALAMGPGQQGAGQNVTVRPNTIYSFSGWGKTTGTGEYAQITFRVTDGSNTTTQYQMSFTLSDWTRQARTITTPATVSSAVIFIMKNAGSGYFYADDISLAAGRDAEAWPFSADSIWNTPIGSNAAYRPAGLSPENGIYTDGEPVVYSDENAPRRSAYTEGSTSANDFGACNRDPSQGGVGIPQGTLQVPDSYVLDNATRSPYYTPNNASGFIQGDGRTLVQFQPTARCSAGGAVFGYRGTDLDLYGQGISGTHYGSGLAGIGGSIRLGEMLGPDEIHHALQLEIWMAKYASNNPPFRWPADRADGYAPTVYCTIDPCKSNPAAYASVKQGALLALPPTLTAAGLGIKTATGLKIFRTLQDYGAYLVDDTYGSAQNFGADYGVDQEMQGAYGYSFTATGSATGAALDWFNDVSAIVKNLAVIDNNGPSSIGGGGTPRVAQAPAFVTSPPPAPTALDRTGWAVTASLNNANASKMLDGNPATSWSTNQTQASGQNVVVDLQSPRSFNQVSLDASANSSQYPQGYDVYVSNDGTNWGAPIHSGTGSGVSPTLATFPTQTARYVKVQLSGGQVNNQPWSIGEFNLYTTYVRSPAYSRSGWVASASSSATGDVPANALDGNPGTRWSTGQPQTPGAWFSVDMQDQRSFNTIVLDATYSPNDYPAGYAVYVSNDGTNWGSPVATATGTGIVNAVTLPTQLARYLKIQLTASSGWWWSIGELNVFQ